MEREGIRVDKYGGCVWDSHHSRVDLEQRLKGDYLFYLSFENSLCKDYITEKYFRNLKLNVINVVRGGADYDRLLPNGTFINTAWFSSAKELVAYMKKVSANETEYMEYLRTSDKYTEQVNNFDHNKYTWCHLCERLNNLDEYKKTYTEMVDFLADGSCFVANDVSLIWFCIEPGLLAFILVSISICCCNRCYKMANYLRQISNIIK